MGLIACLYKQYCLIRATVFLDFVCYISYDSAGSLNMIT